jgi:hypothetical protein
MGWLVLALSLCAGPAFADAFEIAELHLRAGAEPGTYELNVRLPRTVGEAAELTWPAGCRQVEFRRQSLGHEARASYRARCDRTPSSSAVIVAPWRVDGARLTVDVAGSRTALSLPVSGEAVAVPFSALRAGDRGWLALAPVFTWQGMLHIWQGWDHLAFVLCLCALARGWALLRLVTAFTVGHSVSLALAFFDVLRLPGPPTEAMIALTIALVAREGALAGAGRHPIESSVRADVVVVVFGLVHGLGFATALRELGVADGERWPALAFFNLGVEAGQLAFVALVLVIGWLVPRAIAGAARRMALYVSGIVGCFWLVERVASFG